MLQLRSVVKVVDNSGATAARIIGTIRTNRSKASIGDRVVLSITAVKSADEGSKQSGKAKKTVEKSSICHGIIVRTKKEVKTDDGTRVRYGDNAVVLVKRQKPWSKIEPIGTRAQGILANELASSIHSLKFMSLLPKIV